MDGQVEGWTTNERERWMTDRHIVDGLMNSVFFHHFLLRSSRLNLNQLLASLTFTPPVSDVKVKLCPPSSSFFLWSQIIAPPLCQAAALRSKNMLPPTWKVKCDSSPRLFPPIRRPSGWRHHVPDLLKKNSLSFIFLLLSFIFNFLSRLNFS